MYDSSKNILSKKNEINKSFCREIIFHGKEILSYCTTSSLHLNEKNNQTLSCLSVKDIVSVYFPWSSIEKFIQICGKKRITRFKPDKSTDYDSSLRLVNIQELENHWSFIIKELLPNTQTNNDYQSNQLEKDKLLDESSSIDIPQLSKSNEIFVSNVNVEQEKESIELSLKENVIDKYLPNNNENLHLLNLTENGKTINDCLNTIQQDISLENQQDSSIINEEKNLSNKKKLKRRRRQIRLTSYSAKQKRKKYLKKLSIEQFWMKKYSIEPFSIRINRCQSSED
ncbi:unnamed protein product [Adineta steineri]|uniref:Uncharacterized protein n=1 Tax=Adineta steineri TaxID=433720 RepID=A0A818RZS4_9BILA|nr:unnamed protein product [Adineta steineri]CAF3658681.1 unnamed protein product [Adineta steineri]